MNKINFYLNGEYIENRQYILEEFLKENKPNNKIFTPKLYMSYSKIKPLPGVYMLCFSNRKNYLGYSDDILKDLTLIYLYLKEPNKEKKIFTLMLEGREGWRDLSLLAPYKKEFFSELSTYLINSKRTKEENSLKYSFAANTLFYIDYTTSVDAAKIIYEDFMDNLKFNNVLGSFYNTDNTIVRPIYNRCDSAINKKELFNTIEGILTGLPPEALNGINNSYTIVLPDGDKFSFKSKNTKPYLKKILSVIGCENPAFFQLSNIKIRSLLETKKYPMDLCNTLLITDGVPYRLGKYVPPQPIDKDTNKKPPQFFYNFLINEKEEDKNLEIKNEMKRLKTQRFSELLK